MELTGGRSHRQRHSLYRQLSDAADGIVTRGTSSNSSTSWISSPSSPTSLIRHQPRTLDPRDDASDRHSDVLAPARQLDDAVSRRGRGGGSGGPSQLPLDPAELQQQPGVLELVGADSAAATGTRDQLRDDPRQLLVIGGKLGQRRRQPAGQVARRPTQDGAGQVLLRVDRGERQLAGRRRRHAHREERAL